MANKTRLISIIIPVHNAALFLGQCLDSVIAQTYEDLEIVIVNDDSTDQSGDIIEAYLKKDKRIISYTTDHHNAALTRREGVKFSSADYICFIDSDDIVSENYVEILHHALVKTGAAIATGKITTFINKEDITPIVETNALAIVDDTLAYLANNYHSDDISKHIAQSITAKLFRREIFRGIDYSVIKTSVLEDNYIIAQLLKKAVPQRIATVDSTIYYYRQNPNSTMGTAFDGWIEYAGEKISYPRLFELTTEYIRKIFSGREGLDLYVERIKSREYFSMAQTVQLKNDHIVNLDKKLAYILDDNKKLKNNIDEINAKAEDIKSSLSYRAGSVVACPVRALKRIAKSITTR